MIGILALAASLIAPCTGHGVHQRALLKNRTAPALVVATPPIASVADVVGWAVRPTAARTSQAPVDPREQQVYQVTGYVRLVKLSDDDCDIHLQISDRADGAGPQIVVEIPPNQPEARVAIAAIVGRIGTTPRRFDEDGPRITVVGFAFLDLAHANAIEHWTPQGHGHGTVAVSTLWEIHPVLHVEVAR